MQPDWFGLGDRDLATHLVRSQMLRAGYPLSQVTEALCKRWNPGARLLPASDDRSETHVVITDPNDGERRAIHFQEWWVRYRAQVPSHSFAFVGAEQATAGPGVTDAIAEADVVLLAPSNPVVSIGPILQIPGIRGALRSTSAPVIGYSPSSPENRCAAWPMNACPSSGSTPRRRPSASTSAPARAPGCSTAGWYTKAITPRSTACRCAPFRC